MANECSELQRRSREHHEENLNSNDTSLTKHTPPRSPINKVVNTKSYSLDTATPWKVYSRTRGCHKQAKEGKEIKEAQAPGIPPENMTFQCRKNTNQLQKQQSMGCNEKMPQDQQENGQSGNTEK